MVMFSPPEKTSSLFSGSKKASPFELSCAKFLENNLFICFRVLLKVLVFFASISLIIFKISSFSFL